MYYHHRIDLQTKYADLQAELQVPHSHSRGMEFLSNRTYPHQWLGLQKLRRSRYITSFCIVKYYKQ